MSTENNNANDPDSVEILKESVERLLKESEERKARERMNEIEHTAFSFNHNHFSLVIVLLSALAVSWALGNPNPEPQFVKLATMALGLGIFNGIISLYNFAYRSTKFTSDEKITAPDYGTVIWLSVYAAGNAAIIAFVLGGIPGS